MDAKRFDVACRSLIALLPRRQILATIASAALGLGVGTLVSLDSGLAKDRRRRRKLRHKRRHKAAGGSNVQCRRKSLAQICSGRCGTVKSKKSCGKNVDCTRACSDAGSSCCAGACQTQAGLNSACPSERTPGFVMFDDGTMRCASDEVPACICLGGIYRNCGPGTACVQAGETVVCDPEAQE